MSTHRIGELELTVVRSASGPDRQSAAERFVAEVIERAGDELNRRFPGRVFAVRSLSLHWILRAGDLSSPGSIERYALEIAAMLEKLPEGISRSPEFGDVQIFADRSRYWASYVRCRAIGAADRMWAFDSLHSGVDPLVALVEQRDGTLTETVLRMLAAEDLHLLMNLLTVRAAEAIASQMSLLRDSPAPPAADELEFLKTAAAGLKAAPLPSSAGSLMVIAFAYLLSAAYRIASPARAREWAGPLAALVNPDAFAPPVPAPAKPEPSGIGQHIPETVFTRYGGLFYLVNVLLQQNLGEILWKACVDERAFFRSMFLSITGEEDPAIDLLSGAAREEKPSAASDQHDEIAAQLRNAPVWLSADGDVPSRLTAAIANSVLGGLAEMLELRPPPPFEELRDILRIRGRLSSTDGELRLLLPMENIDIRVRRAGLDRDPGWVPWLERNVRITFEETGTES